MSKRNSQSTVRPLAATAAAIGSAGLIIGAPAAGLLAAPGLAQAAPVVPAPLQSGGLGDLFGSSGLSSLFGSGSGLGLGSFSSFLTPVFDIAGAIPVLNIFIGNGA